MTLYVFLGIIAVVAVVFFGIYNSLVAKKNQVENAFGGIDALLTKRYDLIPNLIETVKQYMTHERETLTAVTEMRAKAMSGNVSNDEKVELNNMMGKALGGIMVAVENYPDLKASENFQQLQRSFNEVEEQISAARRSYNASVTDYNNSIEMFPSNIVAGMIGYQRKKVFEAEAVARERIDAKKIFNS